MKKAKLDFKVTVVASDGSVIAMELMQQTKPNPIMERGYARQTEEEKYMENVFKAMAKQMPAMQMMMQQPPTQRNTYTHFWLSEEEYAMLGKPTVGDSISIQISKGRKTDGEGKTSITVN